MRVVLVRPGAGSPEVLPLEAWQALTSGAPVFAHAADPLAARLREAGFEVTDLPEGEVSSNGSTRGLNLLHSHGEPSAAARTAAATLVAIDAPEVVHIVRDDDEVRAVMSAALERGLEVEVVIGRAPDGHLLLDAVALMARLRGPGGCPWDAEQTHESLAKHLLDESYEVLEAIDRGEPGALADELGDLLLQVLFHAQMGRDAGTFDIDDVAKRLTDKLIERHPHVFGDVEVEGAHDVVANWDKIKASGRAGVFDGVPSSLPALAYAQKLIRRASSAGHAAPSSSGAAPPQEEALGEMLLSVVSAAHGAGLDAETALRRATTRWRATVEERSDA